MFDIADYGTKSALWSGSGSALLRRRYPTMRPNNRPSYHAL